LGRSHEERAAVTSLACIGIASLLYNVKGATFPLNDVDVWLPLGGTLAYTTLFAVLGVALGSFVRNQTVAVAGALAWFAVLEHTLVNLLPDIGPSLPAAAGQAIVRTALEGLLSPLAGAALLVAYAAAIAVAGISVEARRDA
jgi:ABC-2 type transport system permease protein